MSESETIITSLAQTGVVGLVLAWFMLRNEQRTDKLTEAINNNNRLMTKICTKLGLNDDEEAKLP